MHKVLSSSHILIIAHKFGGCLGKVLSDKLQRLQNRAFRIISREGYMKRDQKIF